MRPGDIEDRDTVRRRTERALRRLEALAARRRFRVRSRRALRGSLGTAAAFATLVKMKIAGTLAGKAVVALAVGLGLAWPALVIGLVGIVGLALALASLVTGEGGDLPFDGDCDCARKNARVERLRCLIAQRREWLAAPSGPAPRVRPSGQ